MNKIFGSNGDMEILGNEDDVLILKRWNCLEKINFQSLRQYQFENEIKNQIEDQID